MKLVKFLSCLLFRKSFINIMCLDFFCLYIRFVFFFIGFVDFVYFSFNMISEKIGIVENYFKMFTA